MMTTIWLAACKDGEEMIFSDKPERRTEVWLPISGLNYFYLPKGTIEKILGRKLTWDDEAVKVEDAITPPTCPRCNGEGRIRCSNAPIGDSRDVIWWQPCPVCKKTYSIG